MPTGERDAVVPPERPAKSRHAYRTISEVAVEIDVPQHVLRFWETKFTQIRPLKRGGGRRYYRPEDVALLKGIRHLLYGDGYTIRGVQKVLRENGARAVIGLTAGGSGLVPAAAGAPDPDDQAGDLMPLDPEDLADDSDFLAEDDDSLPEEDESEVEALRRLILDLRAELVEIRALLKGKN